MRCFRFLFTSRNSRFFRVIKQRIRDHLRTMHTDIDLQTWFEPLLLRFSDASGLEVRFPHALFAGWFAAERQELFESAVHALLGPETAIVYKRPDKSKKMVSERSALAKQAQSVSEPALPTGVFAAADHCSFDTFIHNRKNEFPFSMAREVASTPKNPAYNPFVICGRGTCGKTHLLKSIARAMAVSMGPEDVFLGTVHDLGVLGTGGIRTTLLRYQAVCLDNAQLLADHPGMQRDIMYIADLFREKKKPLVLALDEEVAKAGLDEKLRSRLESGLIVSLKKPDLDIRLRYAKILADQMRLQLKKEHLLTLVQRFDDFRHIEGTLTKLAAYQTKSGRPINPADLEKVLMHAGTLSGKPISAQTIIDIVAEEFSLSREAILGGNRKADVVQARQIGMYLCRELLGTSLSALGEYFSGKNHATVLHAYKKIKELQDSNKDMHMLVAQLRKKCVLNRS